MDPLYRPEALERRSIFGLTLEQTRNDAVIDRDLFVNAVTMAKQVPQFISAVSNSGQSSALINIETNRSINENSIPGNRTPSMIMALNRRDDLTVDCLIEPPVSPSWRISSSFQQFNLDGIHLQITRELLLISKSIRCEMDGKSVG